MLLAREGLLLRRRPRGRAAIAAVEADAIDPVVHDHRLTIDVGDPDIADVVDGAVVEEGAMVPMAAVIAVAGVAVAIVDAAIEADFAPPIAGMESIAAAGPAPVGGRPQQLRLRRQDPGARHPVVIVLGGIPGPIAGDPDIALSRNGRLLVVRQWRRRDQIGRA